MKSHGQSSKATPHKEKGLEHIIWKSVDLSCGWRGSLKDWPFWFIDLNAGSGYNGKIGCKGSSLIALQYLKESVRKYNAFLCEKSPKIRTILERNIFGSKRRRIPCVVPSFGHCEILRNNKGALEIIDNRIAEYGEKPEHVLGLVISDPDGPGLPYTPYLELARFLSNKPKMDIVFNVNVRSLCERMDGLSKRYHENPIVEKAANTWRKHPIKVRGGLRGFIKLVNKGHWLIRDPVGAANLYVMLVGTNANLDISTELGFHDATSNEGRSILGKYSW